MYYIKLVGVNLEDNDDFIAHLTSDRPLEVLIRGHLWVEAELIGILEDIIPFPAFIDLGRFTFPQNDSSFIIIDAYNKGSYVKIIPSEHKIISCLFPKT